MLIEGNNNTVDDCYINLLFVIDGTQLQVRFLTLMEAIIKLQLILQLWSDACV